MKQIADSLIREGLGLIWNIFRIIHLDFLLDRFGQFVGCVGFCFVILLFVAVGTSRRHSLRRRRVRLFELVDPVFPVGQTFLGLLFAFLATVAGGGIIVIVFVVVIFVVRLGVVGMFASGLIVGVVRVIRIFVFFFVIIAVFVANALAFLGLLLTTTAAKQIFDLAVGDFFGGFFGRRASFIRTSVRTVVARFVGVNVVFIGFFNVTSFFGIVSNFFGKFAFHLVAEFVEDVLHAATAFLAFLTLAVAAVVAGGVVITVVVVSVVIVGVVVTIIGIGVVIVVRVFAFVEEAAFLTAFPLALLAVEQVVDLGVFDFIRRIFGRSTSRRSTFRNLFFFVRTSFRFIGFLRHLGTAFHVFSDVFREFAKFIKNGFLSHCLHLMLSWLDYMT